MTEPNPTKNGPKETRETPAPDTPEHPIPTPKDRAPTSDFDRSPPPKESVADAAAPPPGQADAPAQRYIWSRNIRFPMPTPLVKPAQREKLREGTYELTEFLAIKATVRPEDRVVELGAGIGFVSSFLATRLNVRKIWAFEANPALIPYIRAVHTANNAQVTLHHAVLSARAGPPVPFYLRRDFVASSLCPDGPPVAREVTVPQMAIAPFFEEARPTVLIADIEGAEVDLLRMLPCAGLRLVILEIHPKIIGSAGVAEVFSRLHAAGLIYEVNGSRGSVVVFRRPET